MRIILATEREDEELKVRAGWAVAARRREGRSDEMKADIGCGDWDR